MSTTFTTHRAHDTGPHDVRNAWLSMILLPFALAGAFLIGEGLATQLGWSPESPDTLSLGEMTTVLVPALLVVAVPAAVASWFAARAARRGDRRGWVPAGILLGATVLFGLTNVLAFFA